MIQISSIDIRKSKFANPFQSQIDIRKSQIPMTERDLLKRTKLFALRVIKLVNALPNNSAGRTIGNQLISRELRSLQIIGRRVADVQKLNLSQNREQSKRKLTKAVFGWN